MNHFPAFHTGRDLWDVMEVFLVSKLTCRSKVTCLFSRRREMEILPNLEV